MIGTMLPPIVCEELKVVAGIGTRSPIVSLPSSPSRIRICGLAISLVSLSDLRKLNSTDGIGPRLQSAELLRIPRLLSGISALPSPKTSAIVFADRSIPRSRVRLRLTSSSSMSTTTSPRDLSLARMIRSATLIFSGVSLIVIALSCGLSATRRISSSERRIPWTSLVSALER